MSARLLPFAVTCAIFVLAYGLAWLQFPAILSTRVIGNLLTDNAYLGIVAVGMTVVILSGGIDLSVGAVIAFSGVFVGVMLRDTGLHPYAVFLLLLAITTLFGLAMGAVIHLLEMPPFIVTLAGMFMARGAAYVLSIDSIPIRHPAIEAIQSAYWLMPGKGRLTLIAGVMLLTVAAVTLLIHRSPFGTRVMAVGGDARTARLLGVDVGRTTVAVYGLSGFCAGLAGVVFAIYTSAGYSLATVGTELDAIAAVVIGGTLLTGGSGFVPGTLIGVLIMGLIQTYIVFDGTLSSWWTKIVIGMLLFGFVALQKGLVQLRTGDRAARRRAARQSGRRRAPA